MSILGRLPSAIHDFQNSLIRLRPVELSSLELSATDAFTKTDNGLIDEHAFTVHCPVSGKLPVAQKDTFFREINQIIEADIFRKGRR